MTWDEAMILARRAIYDADGRGMVGRGRNHIQERVARAILRSAPNHFQNGSSSPTTPPDEEAAIEAAVRASENANFQGFLYGYRHVIRDINSPGTPEVWSVETNDYALGSAAMAMETKRLTMCAAITAYKAALCPPDPDVHDPWEDVKESLQGYEGPPVI